MQMKKPVCFWLSYITLMVAVCDTCMESIIFHNYGRKENIWAINIVNFKITLGLFFPRNVIFIYGSF